LVEKQYFIGSVFSR